MTFGTDTCLTRRLQQIGPEVAIWSIEEKRRLSVAIQMVLRNFALTPRCVPVYAGCMSDSPTAFGACRAFSASSALGRGSRIMVILTSLLCVSTMQASPALAENHGSANTASEPEWSTLDPVVVTAPSPRLWKLVRGRSTVWVLGEIEPMPRGLVWNSAPLAHVIQGANRVLLPPEASGGIFEALRALARSRLPHGATLDATLPPALDARYKAVLARLGQNANKPRHDKPAWAALFLELDFIRSRTVDISEPFKTIERLAREKGVRVQRIASYQGAGALNDIVSLPEKESEAALDDAVAGVDYGLDHIAAAGRGWAAGDLRAVRANLIPSETPLIVFLHTPTGKRLGARSVDDTTGVLRSALTQPGTSVAVLRLAALVQKGGSLDQLRAEGVAVAEPPL